MIKPQDIKDDIYNRMTDLRDKFLTEAIGECWHECKNVDSLDGFNVNYFQKCDKCSRSFSYVEMLHFTFSTWKNFGKLWEWAIRQEWFDEFAGSKPHKAWLFPIGLLEPDRFANAVYKFLKEKE